MLWQRATSNEQRAKKRRHTIRQKIGFTLVELAIVLVIIGLLIGGVLVAKSMIETTKIQKYVKDIAQFEIAISNFKENYKYLPGDSPYFTPAGDGDGYLDTTGSGGCNGIYHGWESSQLWWHLSQAKMMDGNFTGLQLSGCGGVSTTNVEDYSPVFSVYNGEKRAIIYTLQSQGVRDWTDDINYSNTRMYSFYLTNQDYIALDKKMDSEKSSKLHSETEQEWGWASSSLNGALTDVVKVVYSPDRALTQAEISSLFCSYVGDCGS